MRRQRTSPKRRPPFRNVLLLEPLEERTLLSTMDGSFQAVMLTNLRSDPNYASINGHGIGIAVIDTGVYARNPDLQANFIHYYDAITDQDSPYGNPSLSVSVAADPVGHGSHVAGIAAASDPNIGVAPSAKLIGIRAVPQPGEAVAGNRDPLAAALQWVVAHHQEFNIRVVNLSIGADSNVSSTPAVTTGERALIAQLQNLGIVVVGASGNAYADFISPGVTDLSAAATLSVTGTWAGAGQFPAQASGNNDGSFLAIERSSAADRLAASSQRSGLANQVAAPGQNIVSSWNGDGGLLHNTLSGTSMAAPIVSGAVALMQQAAYTFGGRYLDPGQVVSILRNTADTITDTAVTDNGRVPIVNGVIQWNQETGLPETGLALKRINIYHAIQAVQQLFAGSGNTDLSDTILGSIYLPPLTGTGSDFFGGSIGQDGASQVGATDIDLYQVPLYTVGNIVVQIGAAVGSSAIEAFLRIFDSSGNEIASTDTGPTGTATLTTGLLSAGTYFIGASGTGNVSYNIINGNGETAGGDEGDYSLDISVTTPDPNGTIGGAATFGGLPSSVSGALGADSDKPGIGAGDVDMFQVFAPDDGKLLVTVDTSAYGNEAASPFLRVFDAQGNERAGSAFNRIEVSVTIGEVLYVAVSDTSNTNYDPYDPSTRSAAGAEGKYDLIIGFDNGDANGTVPTATPIGIGTIFDANVGTDQIGSFSYTVGHDGSKDVDWYFVLASQTGWADFRVTGHGLAASLSVWAFEPGPNRIAKIAETSSTDAELIVPVQFNQTYFVVVTGRGNEGFSPFANAIGSGGQTGDYTLTYNTAPPPGGGGGSDLPNQGDVTIGARTGGTLGQHGAHILGPASYDLYRFVASTTEAITIRTDTSAEESANTFLRFFDANGTELGYNDNANAFTTGSQLVVLVQAGQTYYIGVSGAGDNPRSYDPVTGTGATAGSTGRYLLSVTGQPTGIFAPLPPFSGPDFTLSWSGQPGASGPAIASFDVFVSDNNGPYAVLLKGTTQTSLPFHGETGHTYSFYTVAVDQLGNRSAVTGPQAVTRVDTTPPTSSVTALPTYSSQTFQVKWSGADDLGGSGLVSYDIFVSDSGAPFVRLLQGTTQTSTSFHGEEGHRYGFFSVAVDARGNRQATPTAAQALTLVDDVAPTSRVQALPTQSPAQFQVSWSGVDEGTSGITGFDIYVSDNGGPFTLFLTNTLLESATFKGQEGHSYAFYSVATDAVGNRQAAPTTPQADTLVPVRIYVTTADAGGGPDVRVFDADTGDLRLQFFAFDPRFTGGVRVALGDVNGDHIPDIICAAGPGGGPNISVYNALTGQRLPGALGSFFAYNPLFTGGVYVASGDVNGDGFDDIICGADAGGGPNITVFSGKDGNRLASFFAYNPFFTGGVRVASGDVDGNGRDEIIAGAGPGGGPNVTIFDVGGNLLHSFFAYDPGFTAGIYVAAGDVSRIGTDQIITGAGAGGGPNVAVFTPDGVLVRAFFPFNPAFSGGVRVAAVDRSDGSVAIVSVPGPGGGPDVKTVDGLSLQEIDDFFAYDPRFSGGLYVAAR